MGKTFNLERLWSRERNGGIQYDLWIRATRRIDRAELLRIFSKHLAASGIKLVPHHRVHIPSETSGMENRFFLRMAVQLPVTVVEPGEIEPPVAEQKAEIGGIIKGIAFMVLRQLAIAKTI